MKISLLFLLISSSIFAQTTFISTGSTWKYKDDGSNQGTAWRNVGFDDVLWSSGISQLGYGENDEQTVVSFGTNSAAKHITTYFRRTVSIADKYSNFKIRVKRDDGIVVYFNGTEVYSNNMPVNPAFNTLATADASDDGQTWQSVTLAGTVLNVGTNTIAVEIHQSSAGSSDISFDMELLGLNQYLVSSGAFWKFKDDGSNQGTAWRNAIFDDQTWGSGASQLGYGEGDEQTVISYGGDPAHKYITSYFRKQLGLYQGFSSYTLRVKRDDGIVVYFNGTEVFRDGLPSNPAYNTTASEALDDGQTWISTTLSASVLSSSTINQIAVEIHQLSESSSDVSFDFELIGNNLTANVTRGPYLQMATDNSMQIRWRTDVATDSRVYYGTSPTFLDGGGIYFADNAVTTEHIINLPSLSPQTKYYYAIGSNSGIFQTSNFHYFYTSPSIGSTKKTKVWVTGDCGSNLPEQVNVKNAFQNYIGNSSNIDLWLLLGDNAYNSGLDVEYQTNFFEKYQEDRLMKQTPIFPAPGNHDYANILTTNRNQPYYQNFTMPTAAQIGGLASGTEAYYSFNYANIHFVSLDSYGTETANNYRLYDTTATNPQITWLKQDLAANTQKWTILYWHHPPYTMGSHNSDTEGELKLIREKTIKMLDNYKVDLILCGHSHNYERTRLIKGHYGLEPSFSSALHNKSTSSGKYDGTTDSCPYFKKSTGANEGIVYVVAGSAGRLSGTQVAYPHDATYYSNSENSGSLYLEIEGNRLDAKWIDVNGSVMDKFTMMKDVNKKTDISMNASQPTLLLTASWIGTSYNWLDFGLAPQTKLVNLPINGHSYIVEDDKQCLRDTFKINTITPICQSSFILPNDIGGSSVLKFEATDNIDAYNDIYAGTNVKYDAGKTIILNSGFQAKAGSVFSAYIDGCGNLRKKTDGNTINPPPPD